MRKKVLIAVVSLLLFYSCTKREVIFDGVGNRDFELPLILKLNGKQCSYDSDTKTLKYSLSTNELNGFSPFVQFQDYSAIKLNGVSLANNVINNLGKIELYKGYDLEITTNGEMNLLQLVFTNIPIVQIVTLDEITNEPKILGKMQVSYPNQTIPAVNSWIGIEKRGASTADLDKNSYGFELYTDKYSEIEQLWSFFDFKTTDRWILDAMFIDLSRIRNKTSFDVWKSMSSNPERIGINSQFVEVFLNSESLGLYNFSEIYSEEYLGLTDEAVAYTSIDNSDVSQFIELPEDQPNGIFWEDWEQKHPNPSEVIAWNDFKILNELVTNESDDDFINHIEQHIDIDNVIDYFLFVNVCNGYDNVGKNWYFLKRNQNDKFRIIIWDLDATWGRNSQGETLGYSTVVTNGLFNRFLQTDAGNFKSKLKARWLTLRGTAFSYNNLTAMFDNNFNELASYNIVSTENRIWNVNINLVNEKSYMFNWINNRLIFLDSYFLSL